MNSQLPEGMKQAELVIWRSPNGRDQWQMIKPADVPEWVKHPNVLGRMVAGEMASDVRNDPFWYRAEPAPSDKEIRRIFGNAQRHAKIDARKRRRRAH